MSETTHIIGELGHALRVQCRVIGALILREMRTRFGHSKFGYFWALGEPIVHVAILSALFSVFARAAQIGTSVEVFFFTGVVPLLLYLRITDMLTHTINANLMLFTYPMVRPIDAIVGRVILETATIFLSTLLIAVVFYALDLPVFPDEPARVLLALFGTVLLSTGVGSMSAAICIRFRAWGTIWSWIQRSMYIISGLFFVADAMPEAVRDILWWLPIAHCIAWVRSAFYAGYESHFLDVSFVLFCGLGALAIGLLLLRAMRHRIYE